MIVLWLLLLTAPAQAVPSWTMSPTFSISNTGTDNIDNIAWTAGFWCPYHKLRIRRSMQCKLSAGTTVVRVTGSAKNGPVPALTWSKQPTTAYCLGEEDVLTTDTGERLTCP